MLHLVARKDGLVPEQSKGLMTHGKTKDGRQRYTPGQSRTPDLVVRSDAVLGGPDLWKEARLQKVIFMSGRLMDAMRAEGITGSPVDRSRRVTLV
ncbi:hypothetical protein HKCCE2091_19185 [Rhodobacterales bacterium HKCCE2091]|nr:hypothetical protein [Rhodobacterales bacterium HKCCE2091]